MDKKNDKKPLSQYKLHDNDKNRRYSVVSKFISNETNETNRDKSVSNDVKGNTITKEQKVYSTVALQDNSNTTSAVPSSSLSHSSVPANNTQYNRSTVYTSALQTDRNAERQREQHEQESRRQNITGIQKKAMAVHSMLDVQSEEKAQAEKAIERTKQESNRNHNNTDSGKIHISYTDQQYKAEQPKQQIQTNNVQYYAPTYRPIRQDNRKKQDRRTSERGRNSFGQEERNTKEVYKKITQIKELTAKKEAQKQEAEKRQELSKQQQQKELRIKAQQLQERLKAETIEQQKRNEFIENQKRDMFKKSFSDTQNEQRKEEARHEEQRVAALTAFGALSQKRSEDNTKSVQLSKDKYSREENIDTYKKAKRQKEYFEKKKKGETAQANKEMSGDTDEKGNGISFADGVMIAKDVGKGVATGAAIVGTAAEVTAKAAYKTAKFSKDAVKNAQKIQESLSSGNSIGQAGSNAVKEVERQAKEEAKRTTKKTARYTAKRLKDAAVESSKKAYQALKRERLNRIAKRKAYQAMRRRKEAFYKAQNDIRPSNLLKLLFAKGIDFIGHFGQGSVSRAAIICVIAVIIVVLTACMVVPILFFWLDPHSSEVYNKTSKSYETLDHKTDKEVLESYYSVIQDYIDKSQIEILHRVDKDWGGFDPDDYEWDHVAESEKNRYTRYYVFFEPTLQGEYEEYYGNDAGYTMTKSESFQLHGKFKQKALPGYSSRILVGEIEYWTTNSKGETVHAKDSSSASSVSVLNEGYISDDSILNLKVTAEEKAMFQEMIKNTDRRDIYNRPIPYRNDGYVLVKEHDMYREWDVLKKNIQWNIAPGEKDGAGSWQYIHEDEIRFNFSVETEDDYQDYDNTGEKDIWELNQFKNKWIEFNEEWDYESMIAIAALKKLKKLDGSLDGSAESVEKSDDSGESTIGDDPEKEKEKDTESDEGGIYHLTEDDFAEVIDNLYNYFYGYMTGPCPKHNCVLKYITYDQYNKPIYVCECGKEKDGGGHKILIGEVVNYTSYSPEFALKNVLGADASTTDMEIFEAYRDYIRKTMGSETKPASTPITKYSVNPDEIERLKDKFRILYPDSYCNF